LQIVFDLFKTDVTHSETGSSIAPPQKLQRVQEGQKQSYHRNRHAIPWNRATRGGITFYRFSRW